MPFDLPSFYITLDPRLPFTESVGIIFPLVQPLLKKSIPAGGGYNEWLTVLSVLIKGITTGDWQ